MLKLSIALVFYALIIFGLLSALEKMVLAYLFFILKKRREERQVRMDKQRKAHQQVASIKTQLEVELGKLQEGWRTCIDCEYVRPESSTANINKSCDPVCEENSLDIDESSLRSVQYSVEQLKDRMGYESAAR